MQKSQPLCVCYNTGYIQKTQANMQMFLAAKAHKARCLKILTTARKAIEEESEKLATTFWQISMHKQPNIDIKPQESGPLSGEPFTPSPTLPGPTGKHTPASTYISQLINCNPLTKSAVSCPPCPTQTALCTADKHVMLPASHWDRNLRM
jgi:hypothetical protein